MTLSSLSWAKVSFPHRLFFAKLSPMDLFCVRLLSSSFRSCYYRRQLTTFWSMKEIKYWLHPLITRLPHNLLIVTYKNYTHNSNTSTTKNFYNCVVKIKHVWSKAETNILFPSWIKSDRLAVFYKERVKQVDFRLGRPVW